MIRITTWDGFADATVTHDQRARQMGRELAARTPKHAGKGRIRKPNRRRGAFAAVTAKRVTGVFLFFFFLGAVFPQLGSTVAHAATISATPAQEAAACSAVYHFHHMNAIDYGGAHVRATERAWYHAQHLARFADPDLRAAIRHYLNSGNGWSMIPWLCGSGL